MEIKVEPKERYFIVHISGTVSSRGLLECIKAVGDAVGLHGLTRALLDERGATHEADMYEAYLAGESEEIVAAAMEGYRLASVPSVENMNKNKVFETLMQNRSVNYRVFDSIEAAEAWLLA